MTSRENQGRCSRLSGIACLSPVALAAALFSPLAGADGFSLGNSIEGEYKLTLNYSISQRVEEQSQALINGPVDPFQSQVGENGQLIGFTHTGLPTTINFDDGNRNFKKGALTHNRVTAYGEFKLVSENYGLVMSGDAFYDDVYARAGRKNDHDSPETSNNALAGLPHNEFTPEARRFNGKRARILDAYMYGEFPIGDEGTLNLRLGQQVVAWGESLFLYGVALSQGRADATRAYVPGAETKEILLPTNQVALRYSPGWNGLTFLSYYKLDFKATEIFPAGDYLSPADLVGPGGQITYGSLNPAYANGCPGLLDLDPLPIDLSGTVCEQNGLGGPILGASEYIVVPRGPDIEPSQGGQWGAGFTMPIGTSVNLGLYHLRYHSSNPLVQLNPGFAQVTTRPPLTTEVIMQYVPVSYQIGYADGIHLTGLSFSTVLGLFNVAGEFIYRDNVDVQVQADISGVRSPVYTRGEIAQFLLSSLFVVNPNLWFDEFVFVGEAGIFRLMDAEPFPETDGIVVVGDGTVPFGDRESVGYQTLFLLTKRNWFDAWDLKTQFSWGEIVKGNPPLVAAFGALYGEGDQRASVSLGVQYLQNLEFALSYNAFLGDENAKIGESTLSANPYVDRDYVALNIKYNL